MPVGGHKRTKIQFCYYCDMLTVNVSLICGFWILCSVYWINCQAEFTINYYTLNLIVNTLLILHRLTSCFLLCSEFQFAVLFLRASCRICYSLVTAFTSYLELPENCFENQTELDSLPNCPRTPTELKMSLASFGTSMPTTHWKLSLYCWNVCTNHCTATVAALNNCWAGYCLATNRKQSFFYCCVATNRRDVFTSALRSNEQ
jgi:hypothetical protein